MNQPMSPPPWGSHTATAELLGQNFSVKKVVAKLIAIQLKHSAICKLMAFGRRDRVAWKTSWRIWGLRYQRKAQTFPTPPPTDIHTWEWGAAVGSRGDAAHTQRWGPRSSMRGEGLSEATKQQTDASSPGNRCLAPLRSGFGFYLSWHSRGKTAVRVSARIVSIRFMQPVPTYFPMWKSLPSPWQDSGFRSVRRERQLS